jgi:hypothetical protein
VVVLRALNVLKMGDLGKIKGVLSLRRHVPQECAFLFVEHMTENSKIELK